MHERGLTADSRLRPTRGIGVLVTALLLAPATAGPSPSVLEQEIRVRVSPTRVELRLAPGERAVRPIEILNEGNESVEITARLSDWTLAADGSVTLAAAGSTDRSCAETIRMLPERMRVPAGGRAETVMIVEAPAATAGVRGTRWASVLFELPDVLTVEGGEPLLLAVRMSTTVYVTPPDSVSANLSLAAPRGPQPSPILGAELSNPGETARRFSMSWTVADSNGTTVAELEQTDQVILPWGRLRYRLPVPQALSGGEYDVTVRLIPHLGTPSSTAYLLHLP